VDLKDRICIVTGASSGIGRVTALELARGGATLVLVCRNRSKGETTEAEIRSATGNSAVHLICGDLSSQNEIRQVVKSFKERFGSLHVLVNNAGALICERKTTADGIEMTFGLNHMGYFLLTTLLLGVLEKSAPSRIVNVASSAHAAARNIPDDIQNPARYSSLMAYAQSKLANIMFTYELSRRLEGKEVTVNCLHPGGVNSSFYNDTTGMIRAYYSLFGWAMRSPEKGAETVVYLSADQEVRGITGKYFKDRKMVRSSDASYDSEASRRLWELSERLVVMK
jgi:NAD(P)-dependent dehydrogenase (short-subunit alcohol dehydrogenase family)